MARRICPPDGLLASSQANAVLCAAPQRLHQSSYTERCALLSLTKSYAITPRSTQARPPIARLRFVVCRALICASVMPLPRPLRRIESLLSGAFGRGVYVITLKCFNRIFDYSLADAFFVRWLHPPGPSEIINCLTVRALAIEFFWPVALFCPAPMELGFGSSPLVRFQAGRCPEDRQCRHRCPIAAPTRRAPTSA